MKKNGAKINRIFSSAACLMAALTLAVFSCFAWFTNNQEVTSGITATLSEGNLTDLAVKYYKLSDKTETTADAEDGTTTTITTYSIGNIIDGYIIDGYIDSITNGSAILLEVSYNVKDGSDTQMIFTSSNSTDFSATGDSSGYTTGLSNAVSLRSVTMSNSEVSSSETATCFYDVSAGGRKDIDFSVDGSEDGSAITVTQYILMEYVEANVSALYTAYNISYSTVFNFTDDITLEVKSA